MRHPARSTCRTRSSYSRAPWSSSTTCGGRRRIVVAVPVPPGTRDADLRTRYDAAVRRDRWSGAPSAGAVVAPTTPARPRCAGGGRPVDLPAGSLRARRRTHPRIHLRRRLLPGAAGPPNRVAARLRFDVAVPRAPSAQSIALHVPSRSSMVWSWWALHPSCWYACRTVALPCVPSPARAPAAPPPRRTKRLAAELLADEKERAEHLMLVDLGRNDVGRIARFGSVRVTDLMIVERYSHVLHIVSQVEGELREGLSALDALRASFPAGTMTGAPKVRAMQIIDELEPERRGPYAGAVGYIASGDARMDLAITIRTCVIAGRNRVDPGGCRHRGGLRFRSANGRRRKTRRARCSSPWVVCARPRGRRQTPPRDVYWLHGCPIAWSAPTASSRSSCAPAPLSCSGGH